MAIFSGSIILYEANSSHVILDTSTVTCACAAETRNVASIRLNTTSTNLTITCSSVLGLDYKLKSRPRQLQNCSLLAASDAAPAAPGCSLRFSIYVLAMRRPGRGEPMPRPDWAERSRFH